MRPEKIDWDSGEVTHWDLAFLDPLKPLVDQINSLKEDLAQVKYSNEVIWTLVGIPIFPRRAGLSSESFESPTGMSHYFLQSMQRLMSS
jgi:hypothetical protein